MDSTQTSKACLSREVPKKPRKTSDCPFPASAQLAPAHLERAMSWSSRRDSRLDQARLQQLRNAQPQEIPTINPASRAIADLLRENEEVRPKVCVHSQETSPVKAIPNSLRIKNSLKRLSQPGLVHLDVKLFKGCLSVCASPARNSPVVPKPSKIDERMRSLKKRMELASPPVREPQPASTGSSLFDRTTGWKRRSQAKISAEAQRKLSQDLSECTFHPRTTTKKRRKAQKPAQSSQSKYAPLSGAATSIGFSTGFNMQQFRAKAKALVNYKLLALQQEPK